MSFASAGGWWAVALAIRDEEMCALDDAWEIWPIVRQVQIIIEHPI